jgi:hypothetical protein
LVISRSERLLFSTPEKIIIPVPSRTARNYPNSCSCF